MKIALIWVLVAFSFSSQAHEREFCRSLTQNWPNEDHQRILDFQGGVLADELALAQQIQRFLDETPDSFFAGVGAMFSNHFVTPFSDEGVRTLKYEYGDRWPEYSRRELILLASYGLASPEVWDQITPTITDPPQYRFLLEALTRLKAGVPSIKTPSQQIARTRILAFLNARADEIPPVATLLKESPVFRKAFIATAKRRDNKFILNLAEAPGQALAMQQFENRAFGNRQKFLGDWFLTTMELNDSQIRREIDLVSFAKMSVRDQIFQLNETWTRTGMYGYPVRPFIYLLFGILQTGAPTYSAKQVRQAIEQTLQDHLQTLHALVDDHQAQTTESPNDHPLTAYQGSTEFTKRASNLEETGHDLSLFTRGQRPLSELKTNQDYSVTFRRPVAGQTRTQIVRFTARAVRLLINEAPGGIDGLEWLRAIEMGPTFDYGGNGLKFLRGPISKEYPTFSVEVKIVKTVYRLLGVHSLRGIEFDVFLKGH